MQIHFRNIYTSIYQHRRLEDDSLTNWYRPTCKITYSFISSWRNATSQVVVDNFLGLQSAILVLVVDERGSFSAIDAHIFPCLVQTALEDVD